MTKMERDKPFLTDVTVFTSIRFVWHKATLDINRCATFKATKRMGDRDFAQHMLVCKAGGVLKRASQNRESLGACWGHTYVRDTNRDR